MIELGASLLDRKETRRRDRCSQKSASSPRYLPSQRQQHPPQISAPALPIHEPLHKVASYLLLTVAPPCDHCLHGLVDNCFVGPFFFSSFDGQTC